MVEDEVSFEPAPYVVEPAEVALGWAFFDRAQYGRVAGSAKDAP